MSVRAYEVRPTDRKSITAFIEQNHYSGSINGCMADYCFSLHDGDTMIGAMFYGRMAMAGQWKRFSTCEADVTELRRLCCIDDTPKNTESYFIGWTLRWLKRNTPLRMVVSYADAEYGHQGTIYKASNFVLEGRRAGARVIVYAGKKYHDKTIRTKYKGELKPFAARVKAALESGKAEYVKTAGKFCYVYALRKPISPKPAKLPHKLGD